MNKPDDMSESPHGFPRFDVRIQSTNLAIREGLATIRKALAPLKLNIEQHGTIELVLAEVLNNIVEHAYSPLGKTGTILVTCSYLGDGLHVTITDQGAAFADGEPPLGWLEPVEVDFDDLPEGGFGWFLIKNLAKDIRYTRKNGENQLNLRLAVRAMS